MHSMRTNFDDADPTQDAEVIRIAVRALHRYTQHALQGEVESLGFTLPQVRVLRQLVDRPGLGIKQLAERLGLSQSTVSGIVDRLLLKGVLTKRPRPDDRRAVQLWLSEGAERFMERDRTEFVTRPLRGILERLEPDARRQVIGAFRLLQAVLDEEAARDPS